MNKKTDPNQKHYFDEITLEDFQIFISKLLPSDNKVTITVWEKGEKEDLAETYIAYDYDRLENRLKLNPTGSLITKIAGSKKTNKDVFIKIPIDSLVHVFTVAKLFFHSGDLKYSLVLNQPLYKSQKRKNFRLETSNIIPVQFKIDHQVFDSLDISIGGTSFLIPIKEKNRFQKGQIFTETTLRFDRKNYFIPKVKIAGIFPENEHSLKVGISFLELPLKVEDELYVKITTEARGLEMKNKFELLIQEANQKKDSKAG